ncbi:hypothetical protein FRC01_013585 [Tulasnella sp. 417]|nr:hypothetical protein FRC01_013585 [Tulasnella sp. 417]
MAGGLHVHRGNSTTVLLRHYPELSDLYQGSTDFCNSFWGPDDCGVEILFARIRSAARTMEELRCFWKKRIAVEAEYAKKLAELGKFPLGTNETGDLRAALDTLRVQTEKQATQHFTCVQTMKLELEESVDDFIDRQNNHNITFQAAIESSYKAKKTRERDVEKARENFESDCELYNLYHARYTRLEGEELDGVPARLTMLAESMITAEKNYQNLTRTLGKQWKRWQGEWKSYCDSCEMVRVKLEDVDVAKELDKFVKDHGTGPMMEEAIPFISYKTSPSQLMRKPKMANFLRTSARAPMKCPTLPVGPLQAEPAGPGAVGTEKVHGNPNSTNSRQNIQQDPENGRNTTTSIQPSPPVTPVFQSTVLSYQLTGNSFASTTTASTRLNQRAQQQPQKAPTRGVDPPTVPRVGGASPVDTTVDIDSARSLTGGVEDQNDILAREPSASKKGREAAKTEVGNIESSAAISLGPVKALYDYKATIPEEFDFLTGDIIAVTATPDSGWWLGMLLDESRRTPGRMVFPSNFVCLF